MTNTDRRLAALLATAGAVLLPRRESLLPARSASEGTQHKPEAPARGEAFPALALRACVPSLALRACVMILPAAVLLGGAAGCQRPAPAATPQGQPAAPPAEATAVRIVKPERKTVRHPIEQPGFNVEAFQETPLYAKISGYVRKWNVDIGDRVKQDQVLAELDVPEMEVDLKQKEAAVRQAEAQVQQAKAAVLTAQAQLARAKSQYERLSKAGRGGVIGQEDVEETRLGYESAQAGLEKARADVAAAEAQVEVSRASRDYARTMLRYTQVRAPYEGVVTQRNINTGDFIQPASTGARGVPLYVVNQTDPVRVFVNVPGSDAAWVRDGDPVGLRLQGAGGELFQGKVTRNARSLDPRTRTLRTEIDIPNPEGKLLPGMYVQASITMQHPGAWALPAAALVTEGDQAFCYRVVDGKAVRTPLQVGLRGGGLVEVLKKQVKSPSPGEEGRWEDVTGDDEVVGDPAGLGEGQPVRGAAEKK
jgi:HlyD family secretion protein